MPDLKLGKLPDRTPVRITITVSPELNRTLRDYAAIYRETYGEPESVASLIPFMLRSFLDSDRGFVKARKERRVAVGDQSPDRARRRSSDGTASPTTATKES